MDKRSTPPVGIGVSSILTVLLTLTLAVFSALTLTSAQADLALSRINADTVTAYYAADCEAAQLYKEFAAGDEAELLADVPMTESQVLRVHLVREADGVRVLAWQTVPLEAEMEFEEPTLPVWGGEMP